MIYVRQELLVPEDMACNRTFTPAVTRALTGLILVLPVGSSAMLSEPETTLCRTPWRRACRRALIGRG
jgi:hypothetical protein